MKRELNLLERIVLAQWLDDQETLEGIERGLGEDVFEEIERLAVDEVLAAHGKKDTDWHEPLQVAAGYILTDFDLIEDSVPPGLRPDNPDARFPFRAASASWGQWVFPGRDDYELVPVPGTSLLALVVSGSQGWDPVIAIDACDHDDDLSVFVCSGIESWWGQASSPSADEPLPAPTRVEGSALIPTETLEALVEGYWSKRDAGLEGQEEADWEH